jgi:hypothetical protein
MKVRILADRPSVSSFVEDQSDKPESPSEANRELQAQVDSVFSPTEVSARLSPIECVMWQTFEKCYFQTCGEAYCGGSLLRPS